jgi:myo-inositol-1(or 4)-monophosphatase
MHSKERRFAVELAKKAGKIIQKDFKLGMKSWYKKDKTVVTKADIQINHMVMRSVKKMFPNHSILAEEESDMSKKSNKIWVCDPLDGTLMFMHGVPNCVFSLAYVEDGKPVVGVVFDPFTNRMFYAEKGRGAYLNGKRIYVSTKTDIKYSLMGLCCWKDRGSFADISDIYKKLIHESTDVLDIGSITYLGALVAAGQIEASIHPATASHDSAALKIIVEEAGGKVTDLFGDEQRYDQKIKGCIISNGLVHNELVKIVRSSIYS